MIQLRAMFVVCALLITAAFGQPFWGEYNVQEAGSEPDTYYYSPGASATCGGSSINSGWQPSAFTYGNNVDVLSAGTASTIGACFTSTAGTDTVKIALYDNSSNLIASGSGDPGADGWFDITISAAVAAATYHVQTSSSTDGTIFIQYLGGDAGNGCATAYAAFPTDPLAGGCIGAEGTSAFQTRICVGTC